MKSTIEVFKECSAIVMEEFADADACERLRAALSLVDLTLRQNSETGVQKRWEDSQKMQPVS